MDEVSLSPPARWGASRFSPRIVFSHVQIQLPAASHSATPIIDNKSAASRLLWEPQLMRMVQARPRCGCGWVSFPRTWVLRWCFDSSNHALWIQPCLWGMTAVWFGKWLGSVYGSSEKWWFFRKHLHWVRIPVASTENQSPPFWETQPMVQPPRDQETGVAWV